MSCRAKPRCMVLQVRATYPRELSGRSVDEIRAKWRAMVRWLHPLCPLCLLCLQPLVAAAVGGREGLNRRTKARKQCQECLSRRRKPACSLPDIFALPCLAVPCAEGHADVSATQGAARQPKRGSHHGPAWPRCRHAAAAQSSSCGAAGAAAAWQQQQHACCSGPCSSAGRCLRLVASPLWLPCSSR